MARVKKPWGVRILAGGALLLGSWVLPGLVLADHPTSMATTVARSMDGAAATFQSAIGGPEDRTADAKGPDSPIPTPQAENGGSSQAPQVSEQSPTDNEASQSATTSNEQDPDYLAQKSLLLSLTSLSMQPRPDGLLWRYADLFSPLSTADGDTFGSDSEPTYNVPIIMSPKVERHIAFFNTAIRDRFEQWLERLGQYRPLVESIFQEFDLPSDLIFLSLVESGFNPHAYSRARATGPWQFMKGTARLYGLRIDPYVDERRDPIKSTVAAARYLRDLYDLFGTWPLALAAYNAGEGKVSRALRKARGESYWDIAKTRYIRRETREYVPRFMAATIIAKDPARFGFSSMEPDPHQFEEVVVSRSVHLRDLAKVSELSYEELRRLNPELRRHATPPTDDEYHLKVPVGTKVLVEERLENVPTWKPGGAPHRREAEDGWYRVRAGDSLWVIAKRFRLSVQELMAKNNLRGRLIKPGQLLAVGP